MVPWTQEVEELSVELTGFGKLEFTLYGIVCGPGRLSKLEFTLDGIVCGTDIIVFGNYQTFLTCIFLYECTTVGH